MDTKLTFLLFLISPLLLSAQDNLWSLEKCLDYALEHSIEMQKGRISIEESDVNIKQAKAQWQPSLSFNTSHSINNNPYKGLTSYNGNYGLNAGWTVFNGFKRKYSIQQQKLQGEIETGNVALTEEEIKIAVLTDYIQVLYAIENLKTKQNSMEVAEADYNRNKQLFEAGAISKSDFSQIEAQYMNEKYQLVVAENDLIESKLNFKLLLRLDSNTEFDIISPSISEEEILKTIPNKDDIYQKTLSTRPEVQNAMLNEKMSELKIKSAKSGYYPSISLNAGVSTGHNSRADINAGQQMKQNFGENIGLSLNYSIMDNRSRRSEVERAKLEQKSTQLQTEKIKDDLYKQIEAAYNDAIAAQMNYVSSVSNEKAAEASFNLTKEKFDLGIRNPYEMLNEKNALIKALQQTLQAKYTAILNIQILNIYQGLPIVI